MSQIIFKYFIAAVSLMTAIGVFAHDGRIDKAAMTAIGASSLVAYAASTATVQAKFADFIATDAHTHPDHNAADSLLRNAFKYQQPSISPRRNSHHKQLKSLLDGGRHPFDNTNLPVLAG